MVFMPLPRYRVHALRLSGYGGVSSPFSLSLLVRSFSSLETSLTHALHCLESTVSRAAFPALLGMSLANLFYSGNKCISGRPHDLAIIEASLYLLRIH